MFLFIDFFAIKTNGSETEMVQSRKQLIVSCYSVTLDEIERQIDLMQRHQGSLEIYFTLFLIFPLLSFLFRRRRYWNSNKQ